MTDKEKKAIERLNIYKEKIKYELYATIDFEEEKALGVVLNLIEKQQKEIEEINTKILSNAGIYQLGFKDGQKSVEDKIKAVTEEIKSRKIANEDIKKAIIAVLQSLLEKE